MNTIGTISLIANGLVILLIIIMIIIARKSDVKKISIKDGLIEFFNPKGKPKILIAPVFSVDPIISQDGRIYKIHLFVSLLRYEKIDITNWKFSIKGIGSMVYKQYFINNQKGERVGIGKHESLPNIINESLVYGIEFEPEKGWQPQVFKKKRYRCQLVCSTTGERKKIEFNMRVRERNLEAIRTTSSQAISQKRAIPISFPIV